MINTPENLKTIIHSNRAKIFYLEKCKVLLNGGRVEYLVPYQNKQAYYNIPVANTSFILLGIGTSITQAAIRHLSSAGVIVGFCGNQGSPFISGPEIDWFLPGNEYRPTEYMQKWASFWFNDKIRLSVAKDIQIKRIEYLVKNWDKIEEINKYNMWADDLQNFFKKEREKIKTAETTNDLLLAEAEKIKEMYKYCAKQNKIYNFSRDNEGGDPINKFLTHGNYLAYGASATVLWTLGISHSFAVLHGKTRRGGLVFDLADIIKDSFVLPYAFIGSKSGDTETEFRDRITNCFIDNDIYKFLFDYVKYLCDNYKNDNLV